MTRDTWLISCSNRLSLHKWDYAEADAESERIARNQAYLYGDDVEKWLPGWAAADAWVEDRHD